MCSAVLALAGFPGFLFLSKQLIEGGRGSKHALPPSPPPPVSGETCDLTNQSLPSDLRSCLALMAPHPTVQD